jgi:hypothetical protein
LSTLKTPVTVSPIATGSSIDTRLVSNTGVSRTVTIAAAVLSSLAAVSALFPGSVGVYSKLTVSLAPPASSTVLPVSSRRQ